ncbi:MAG: Rab proteins geranylgeranyltransferase component A [Thelocarpon impressellum]|nr:MAG: Rab proteins geranylgeranyltransferase component A [Thelocarpon impressellum]
MESLSETTWDVLISGTGLQQSLLALALSRSGKKVLHVDRNEYYGGSDAALSLQEAEAWVKRVGKGRKSSPDYRPSLTVQGSPSSDFRDASISAPEDGNSDKPKLSFSRAYSLSLSPQLIYTRSPLLPVLVSSKVYRQLEFQAVGSWWVYSPATVESDGGEEATASLRRVPSGREDVFMDKTIDRKSKRSLMRFLKFVGDYEEHPVLWQDSADVAFPDFLVSSFALPEALHAPLLAISMSPDDPRNTTTAFALAKIARHLRSIGVFGPGFGAVIPKWGGGAEIAQVACRAGAVGGGVYVLGRGIEELSPAEDDEEKVMEARLQDGEKVKARWIAGSCYDLPSEPESPRLSAPADGRPFLKSISIVSSPLASLLPTTAEGAPPPAGAVVVVPTGSLPVPEGIAPPIYITVHSSDTGECPVGQSLLFASVLSTSTTNQALLDRATAAVLAAVAEEAKVLYTLRYTQRSSPSTSPSSPSTSPSSPSTSPSSPSTSPSSLPSLGASEQIVLFPPPSPLLVFDDGILDRVRDAWMTTTRGGPTSGEEQGAAFMVFEDREAEAEAEADGDVDEELGG